MEFKRYVKLSHLEKQALTLFIASMILKSDNPTPAAVDAMSQVSRYNEFEIRDKGKDLTIHIPLGDLANYGFSFVKFQDFLADFSKKRGNDA